MLGRDSRVRAIWGIKGGQYDNCMITSSVNLTVSRVVQLCCFHCKIRAIDSYNNQWG